MKAAFPLGVDIVEMKDARSFYRTHRRRLGSFLTRREMKFVLSGSRPADALAMLLAAKEAAFKALGGSWMGVGGFRRLKVLPRSPRRFKISDHTQLEVTVRKQARHVIACCHPASSRHALGSFR